MTFDELCNDFEATADERCALAVRLASIRYEALLDRLLGKRAKGSG